MSATPEISQTPTNEIVSRSGRKIKPKRFADDEITTPVTAANKAKAAGSEDSGPPPAKRAKRASKSIGSKVINKIFIIWIINWILILDFIY